MSEPMVRFTYTGGTTVDITADEWFETSGADSFDALVAMVIGNAVVDGFKYEFRGNRSEGELIQWSGSSRMVSVSWRTIGVECSQVLAWLSRDRYAHFMYEIEAGTGLPRGEVEQILAELVDSGEVIRFQLRGCSPMYGVRAASIEAVEE